MAGNLPWFDVDEVFIIFSPDPPRRKKKKKFELSGKGLKEKKGLKVKLRRVILKKILCTGNLYLPPIFILIFFS